jgi:hypothetical protein
MQYITKSEIPVPQNTYKVMYPVDARVRTVKIPPVHKRVLRGSDRIYSPSCKVLVNKKYIIFYPYTIQVYIHEETAFLHMKTEKFLTQ